MSPDRKKGGEANPARVVIGGLIGLGLFGVAASTPFMEWDNKAARQLRTVQRAPGRARDSIGTCMLNGFEWIDDRINDENLLPWQRERLERMREPHYHDVSSGSDPFRSADGTTCYKEAGEIVSPIGLRAMAYTAFACGVESSEERDGLANSVHFQDIDTLTLEELEAMPVGISVSYIADGQKRTGVLVRDPKDGACMIGRRGLVFEQCNEVENITLQ